MPRRHMFLALAVAPAAAVAAPKQQLPPNLDELTDRTLAFELHWNHFVRTLAGCPDAGVTDAEHCDRPKSIDYGAFFKARNAAKKLFGLKDE